MSVAQVAFAWFFVRVKAQSTPHGERSTMNDDGPHPEGPADAEDSGTGIGSEVKSGTGLSERPDNEDNASGTARDATGGLQKKDDDPSPR